jgi:UPF0271 protein
VRSIDLNCDLGEGAGHDVELMPLITSANIACGAHAGDLATMRATVRCAQENAVNIGAHPGFADRENFGRRELLLSPQQIRDLVTEQIERLAGLTPLHHVKPHGALYNLAARDPVVASAIVAAIQSIDPALVLFAPAQSELARVGEASGLRVAREVFADRTYRRDGTLTPRTQPDALIADETIAVAQALHMVQQGRVRTGDGAEIPIVADTICLHGDGVHAVAFAQRLVREFRKAGIAVGPFGRTS